MKFSKLNRRSVLSIEASSPVLCEAKQDEGGKRGLDGLEITVIELVKKFSPGRIVK